MQRVRTRVVVSIKRWLAPPIFQGDEVKTRRATLLDQTLLIHLALALVVLAGNLVGGRTPAPILAAEAAMVPLCLVLRHWSRQGRVRLVGLILLSIDLIGITVFDAILGTIRTPTTAFYLVIVVGAGLIFDVGGILGTTAFSSLAVLGLVWAENSHLLPSPDYAVTITLWVTYTALFGLAGGLAWLGLRSERLALRRADQEIAERKRTEEELKAAEQYAHIIIDSSLDMIVTTDPERRIVEFNRAAEKTFGYTRDQVIGQHVNLLYANPVEGKDVHRIVFEAGVNTQEVKNRRKNGEVFVSQLSAATMRDSQGVFLGVVGVSRDITERKQAEHALRDRADEFAALYDITRDLATQYDLPTLLQVIVERAKTLLGTSCAFLYLFDPVRRNLELRLIEGASIPLGMRLELGEGMAGRVAQSYQPLSVDDYQTSEYLSDQYAGTPFSAILEVPMHYGGELIGVVAVGEIGLTTRKFADADAQLLSLFAGQAASAVYNARLHSAEREQSQFVETLRDIGIALTSQLDPNAVLDQLLEHVGRVVPFDSAAILTLEGDRVRCKRQRDYGQWGLGEWMQKFDFPLSKLATLSKIIETGRPYVSSDTSADRNWNAIEETQHIRSWIGAPIYVRGTLIGFLSLDKVEPGFYTEKSAARLSTLTAQAGIALENARLYALQQQLAVTDDLTGLFNRRHFMELAQRELVHAQRLRSPCAVLMIDLDDFKRVNDTFGHAAGDEALRMVAKSLAQNIRAVDIVARFGGDEFVILLLDCRLPEAEYIAARMQESSKKLQISNEKHTATLSFSIGIGVSTLGPDETLDSLLSRADAEMYKVKLRDRELK